MKNNSYDKNGIPNIPKSKNKKWLESYEKSVEVIGTILKFSVLGAIKYTKILFKKIKESKK